MTRGENLISKEKNAIEELRRRMKNDLPSKMLEDISIFQKFLVARDFNVDKAEKMLRKSIAWRKSIRADNIVEDFKPKEFYLKYVKPVNIGLDKDGNVVIYMPLGKIYGIDIAKCSKLNNYIKHWICFMEELYASMRQLKNQTGRGSLQFTAILNLEKVTIGNLTCKHSIEQCLRLLPAFQDNYPEVLKASYFINAPAYHVLMYSLLKPMMSKEIIRKFHFYGDSGWKDKLLEVIDANVLPEFLGGTRTDPDGNPLCKSFIYHGSRIPEVYFLTDEERGFKHKSLVKRILIPQKEKKEISVDVTERESVIHWEFLIKNKDIGFGLVYEISPEEHEEVLPIQRVSTIDGTEEGSYKSSSIGKYIITFDNSYSWMSSKEIEYCITVNKPA